MKTIYNLFFVLFLTFHFNLKAQQYQELSNPIPTNPTDWQKKEKTFIGWGETDIRYPKEKPAQGLKLHKKIKAWKGERISAQIVFSNFEKNIEISAEASSFKKGSQIIDNQNIEVSFIRFVMTDELNKNKLGTCGYRKKTDFDSTLVADAIDHITRKIEVPKHSTRGIWVKIQVPENTPKGIYKGFVSVKSNQKIIKKLPLEIEVMERVLPPASKWSFHLDLWQNPYAVARFHKVSLWSDAHFEKLETEMKPYAQAGGKSITASIMYQPWGGQTYDFFNSMVMWVKKLDGSWHFDFAVFDKWVEFMHRMGVDKQINCYSMVPWKLSFQYFDQATNQLQSIQTQPNSPEYETMWIEMLKAFSTHLKEKGWFDKTYISMDERPMNVMQTTFKIIKKADPNFKISLAGALHYELEPHLDDYCVALRMKYSDEIKEKRKKQGKITTYYTSCEEPFPNTFTFSPPAESEWLAWYSAKENLDGYLRWALNSWTENPLQDSRFISWGAGDTYLLYPEGRTSVRFEKLVEGIQFYEKIKILRNEFTQNNQLEKLKIINDILNEFDETQLTKKPASELIQKAKQIINSL